MIDTYKCWVFDCDGVLLDSNRVKSEAFYTTALPYGEKAAQRLLDYHQAHGGVSRFHKFEYLFRDILGRKFFRTNLEEALENYARISRDGVLKAAEAPGLRNLLGRLRDLGVRLFVVSGGLQSELREVFKERGLDAYFENIFGSPDTKDDILTRELAKGAILLPALFLGDSRYDYEAAQRGGLDFTFVYTWTEFKDWEKFFIDKSVSTVRDLSELRPWPSPSTPAA